MGHVCAKKELRLIVMAEDEEDDGLVMEFGGSEEVEEELNQTQLSMHTLVGLTKPKTMRLFGEIGDKKVVVMIDHGATHNFNSLEKVEELGIPMVSNGSRQWGGSEGKSGVQSSHVEFGEHHYCRGILPSISG